MLISEPRPDPALRSHARGATARLVLFVGPALRPDETLAATLGREGVRCLWLAGPDQALRAARLARFDAVVVDGALADGALLGALRSALRTRLLVLAPVADEIDEIVALESGADAFLTRPVAPRRLRAHLVALMRRAAPVPERPEVPPRLGGWSLDTLRQKLTDGRRAVALTEVQTLLLQCLFDAAGALVTRAQLMAVLPRGEHLQARSVDVYIHRLRLRLRDEDVQGLAIEAVRGRGFVLRGDAPPGAVLEPAAQAA